MKLENVYSNENEGKFVISYKRDLTLKFIYGKLYHLSGILYQIYKEDFKDDSWIIRDEEVFKAFDQYMRRFESEFFEINARNFTLNDMENAFNSGELKYKRLVKLILLELQAEKVNDYFNSCQIEEELKFLGLMEKEDVD